MKKIFYSMSLMVSMVLATTVQAADDWAYIPYAGVDYIYSTANFEKVGEDNLDPYYNSAAVIMGTTMGKYFSTELFAQASDGSKKELRNGSHLKTDFEAYGLDMIGYLPFGCELKFNLLASFGVGEYHMHSKNKDTGAKKYTDHAWGWRTGVGAQYAFDDNWAVRLMARHVNFDGMSHVDHMMEYSAGIRYFFK